MKKKNVKIILFSDKIKEIGFFHCKKSNVEILSGVVK